MVQELIRLFILPFPHSFCHPYPDDHIDRLNLNKQWHLVTRSVIVCHRINLKLGFFLIQQALLQPLLFLELGLCPTLQGPLQTILFHKQDRLTAKQQLRLLLQVRAPGPELVGLSPTKIHKTQWLKLFQYNHLGVHFFEEVTPLGITAQPSLEYSWEQTAWDTLMWCTIQQIGVITFIETLLKSFTPQK